MRRVAYLIAAAIACLLLATPTTFGQAPYNAGIYCNSGLQPDGYIDLSRLPPAPASNGGSSAPVTAILPVTGVPGLNATISIPAIQTSPGQPPYFVNGSQLKFNSSGNQGSLPSTVLTLSFDHPVYGVGLNVGNLSGRFGYEYTLVYGDGNVQDGGIPFSNTASGYTLDLYTPRSVNLQMVGLDTTFSMASVNFSGEASEGLTNPIISNIRVQSGSAPDPASSIPTDGLQQWLRSDKGATFNDSVWHDQSGNGHDATSTPGHAPSLFADGHTCKPTWVFNGSSSFDFTLPTAGWNEMTLFLVAASTLDPPADSYDSFSAAILWTEDAYWGNTFVSPYQTHVYTRFGTTSQNTNLEYVRPGGGVGGDFTVTRSVHDNGTDSVYVDGIKVLSRSGNNPALGGTTGAGTIGAGYNGTFYNGEISEILVYNRVLSVQEAARVESYLRNKYGTR